MVGSFNGEFLEAIERGDERAVRQMLDEDETLATIKSKSGATPLHCAALCGQADIAEMLLERGAEVNAEDANGLTPLQLAASLGHAGVIRVLLGNGADVNAGQHAGLARLPMVDPKESSALRVLVATMIKHRDMLKRIVETTEPDTSERRLILETVQPTYSDPTQSVFALAIAEATRAGVVSTLSPLIQSVQGSREKLIDLTIEARRSSPSFGAWNEAFLGFNAAINALVDHVTAVEEAAKSAPPKDKKLQAIARFPSLPNLRWEEVIVEFVSNDSVKITAREVSKRYTFAEIGFKDARRGDMPDTRWAIVRKLAEHDGEISWRSALDSKARRKMKTAVKDVRKRLKALMGIDDDPFEPYRKARAYRTKFVLRSRS